MDHELTLNTITNLAKLKKEVVSEILIDEFFNSGNLFLKFATRHEAVRL